MLNTIKTAVLGTVLALSLPTSGMALTTFDFFGRSIQPGDTVSLSDDLRDGVGDNIFGRDNGADGVTPASFSFTFFIENDLATTQGISFDLRALTGLDNFSFSLDGITAATNDDFTTQIGAGETVALVLNFDNPTGNPNGRFTFDIAAVPLPAGILLMLTALGGLVVARSRNSKAATAA